MGEKLNPESDHIYGPGPTPNTVRTASGDILSVPEKWMLLPPGDAALTRRVKLCGEYWAVQEKKGRKIFSRGIWAPAATVDRIRVALEEERGSEAFIKRKESSARRRDKAQTDYVDDFFEQVVAYLSFHPNHEDLARRIASAVTEHATPVGSGTVARTKRIAIEDRAEAAVIAWMRHKTTNYDNMVIPRVKGKRRETRRQLAKSSLGLLNRYRKGEPVTDCVIEKALEVEDCDVDVMKKIIGFHLDIMDDYERWSGSK